MPPAARALQNRPSAPRAYPMKRLRFWLICLFFIAWAGLIAGRLFWLQVVRHKEFQTRAEHLHTRNYEVAPRRGILSDRNGNGLAMTVLADSIYADPTDMEDKALAARALAAVVHTDPDDTETSQERILQRLGNGKNFAWIARRVTPQVADTVRRMNIPGVYFVKEFKRDYPADTMAAQILGYVGADDTGMAGLEAKFDSELHGKAGARTETLDRRHMTVGSTETQPQAGQNLTLTIDNYIQYTAEQALDRTMARTQAQSGTVVIEDVHTGQILALATRPTFNPNQVHKPSKLPIANPAISNVYEPGSTFKLVTYAAVLDQQMARPDEVVDCSGGQINVAGAVIHDDKSDRGLGHITVMQALEHSSDVCAIKMALRVGQQHFYGYMRSFGFGSRSGIELPGETRGMLLPLNKWYASSIGYYAIGQGVAVTPVQLSSMVSTIANGGVYLPPHILLASQADGGGQKTAAQPVRPGEELPNPLPQGSHRVISTMASAEMRKMMEGVVLEGTGKQAQLNGYSSAGKTGTAQKIESVVVNGKTHSFYSKDKHIASFAGFAPVNDPVIAVAVIIDSPKGDYYGASVSAPVFAEVAQTVLEYLGVPHDMPVRKGTAPKSAAVREDAANHDSGSNLDAAIDDLPDDDPLRTPQPAPASPSPNEATTSNAGPNTGPKTGPTPATATVTLQNTHSVRVPQLTGLPVRKVIEEAGAAGFDVHIAGSGVCREQSPAAGSMVAAGTHIQVRCGR